MTLFKPTVMFAAIYLVGFVLWQQRSRFWPQRQQSATPSSEQPRDSVARVAVGVVQLDAAGQCLDANDRWCQMTGALPGTASKTDWFQSVHPADRARVKQEWQQAIEQQLPFQSEYRLQHADGSEIWVQATAEPSSSATVESYMGTVTDITDIKQREALLQQENQGLNSQIAAQKSALEEMAEQLRQETARREQAEALNLLYEAALEATGDAIEITDTNSQYKYVNAAFETMTGYSRREVLGQTAALLPTDNADRSFYENIWNQISSGEKWQGQLINRCKEGSPVYQEVTIAPVRAAADTIAHYVAVKRDVTEQRRTEEELWQTQQFLQTMIDYLPVAVFVKDGRPEQFGQFRLWNQASEAISGLTREQVLGKTVHDFFPPEQADFFVEKDQEAFASRTRIEIPEESLDSFSLGRRMLRTVKVPLYDEDQNPQYLLCISEDITERKRAETEILNALEQARELNELKSRFISITSHEFRTPLTTIQSAVDLLAYFDCDPEQRQELYQQINTAIRALVQLLEGVQIVGQAEAGKITFHPDWFSLERLCQRLAAEPDTNLNRRLRLKLNATCQQVCLDERLVRQLLANLLSNAVKYSAADQPIDLEVNCDRNNVQFRIQDRGIGIPLRDQSRLFEFFYRGSNVSTISGVGLGLAIVKRCVDLHQGTIQIDSIVNQGTTVTVTLPDNRKE